MSYLWSIWMVFTTEITEQICQETTSIEYGDIPEEIIIARSILLRNFCFL